MIGRRIVFLRYYICVNFVHFLAYGFGFVSWKWKPNLSRAFFVYSSSFINLNDYINLFSLWTICFAENDREERIAEEGIKSYSTSNDTYWSLVLLIFSNFERIVSIEDGIRREISNIFARKNEEVKVIHSDSPFIINLLLIFERFVAGRRGRQRKGDT